MNRFLSLIALTALLLGVSSLPSLAADREGAAPAEANRPADGDKAKPGPRDGDNPKPGPREGDNPNRPGPRDGDPAAAKKLNTKEGKVFLAYDKDKDGVVTAKEIEAMMEGKQNSQGRRAIRKWVHNADKDKDDALDIEEFIWWYTIGRKAESAENR